MAGGSERDVFPVPLQGARKDIDELVAGPEAVIDSANVMVYDSVLRPRPACTREKFGQQASTWINITANLRAELEDTDEMSLWFPCAGYLMCLVKPIDTGWSSMQLWVSDDGGETFSEDTTWSGLPIAWNGDYQDVQYIFETPTALISIDTKAMVAAADTTDYPTTALTFVEVGRMDIEEIHAGDPAYNVQGGRDDRVSDVTYDPENGHTLVAVLHYDSQEWFTFKKYFIPDIETATAMVKDTDYFEIASDYLFFNGGVSYELAGGKIFKWSHYANDAIDPNVPPVPPTITMQGFYTPTFGATWEFPFTAIDEALDDMIIDMISDPAGDYEALMLSQYRLYGVDTGPYSATVIKDIKQDVNFYYNSYIADDGINITALVGAQDTATSQDSRSTWDDQPVFPLDAQFYYRPFWIGDTLYFGSFDYDYRAGLVSGTCAIVSGTAYPSGYDIAEDIGDVTSIYQADMDDQERAIMVGSTRKLLLLNRATSLWEEITSSGYPANDPSAGDPKVPDTTLGGVHGVNPVIFRTFETDGKTWIIATNGVDYPLIWHPDLPRGKARFLGQIEAGSADPRYGTGNTESPIYEITGNDAPVAKCMAVAANRLLLANLPGISSGGVDVSDFNDPDRGYGRVQMTILGDTPGAIVSANEISALQVAMYKEDAIYHAVAQTEFLGVAAPFRFELVKAGISGPCSPLCVLQMHTGTHAYLARDGGIYVYDGAAPKDVGRNVRRMIQPYMNDNIRGKSWGMVDPHRKLVWFFYPTKSGALNRGVVMSTDQGYPWPVWELKFPDGWQMAAGMRAFFVTDRQIGEMLDPMNGYGADTLGSFIEGSNEMIWGRVNNTWYTQQWGDDGNDGNYTDDGVPLDILLQTGWNPLGSTLNLKTVHELYHVFQPDGDALSLNVNLLARQLNQEVIEQGQRTLRKGQRNSRTSHRLTGERFSLKMSGQIDRAFRWGGAPVTFTTRGSK